VVEASIEQLWQSRKGADTFIKSQPNHFNRWRGSVGHAATLRGCSGKRVTQPDYSRKPGERQSVDAHACQPLHALHQPCDRLPISQVKERPMRLTKDAFVGALGYNKIAK
jgi:hypothetical protein